MPFAPGEGGALAGAPSLRTAVLDLLGQWDPGAAYARAAEALEGPKDSAAEYALHLRNYAWGAPEAMPEDAVRAYLGRKARELVSHRPWQRDPSSGYQEAFDVLVWADTVEAVPLLTSLLASDAPNLVQPAGLTLDRLVIASPEETLRRLREEGESLDERPQAIAGYFARANPGDLAERRLVEAYFLADERTAETRDYFLSLFPNVNLRLSHNLLSENEIFSHDVVLQRHREARAMLQSWSRDERFDPWQAEIGRAIDRIDEALR